MSIIELTITELREVMRLHGYQLQATKLLFSLLFDDKPKLTTFRDIAQSMEIISFGF